ncbi:MAG: hypothetical protein U5L45_11940 [Saprospiraceae bacterium]|nr:hypothetical protein [Saprospiraceae bacterium]
MVHFSAKPKNEPHFFPAIARAKCTEAQFSGLEEVEVTELLKVLKPVT